MSSTNPYKRRHHLDELLKERVAELKTINEQLQTEIAERKRVEDALRESESEKHAILDAMSDIVVFQDTDLSIRWVNEAAARSVGKTEQELMGRYCYEVWYGRDRPCKGCPLVQALEAGSHAEAEMRLPDGRWLAVTGEPVRDSANNIMGCIEIARDITERKRAEEEIKASLKEKELLLKEVHHRVKNNLQVVSSLLYLQSEHIKDEQSLATIKESQNRIKSMALVHEQLYQSRGLARVDFTEYIQNLATYLFRSYGVNSDAITLSINAGDVSLGIDTAIPCSLIINELVSNSLKHAFPAGKARSDRESEIRINLHADDNRLTLIVSDNGVGLPRDLDFRNTESLGLHLVNTLTTQLEGTIELDRSGGTAFEITFAEPQH